MRGVPLNVRALAVKASEIKGLTVGDWVAEALVAYSRSDKGGVSADGGANVPAIPLPAEITTALDDLRGRLERIEADRRKPLLSRIFGGRS